MTATATFDELVLRHQREVLRVCRSILRDEHLGADAAQETFVRLWRRVEDGHELDRASGWLRQVAVNASLDMLRRRGTRVADVEIDESVADPRAQTAATVRADVAELGSRLEIALAELSEGQRTVFLLRHEGGLALAEVAETLGVALPTVKTQFARACLKLQTKLAAHRIERSR